MLEKHAEKFLLQCVGADRVSPDSVVLLTFITFTKEVLLSLDSVCVFERL